MRIIYPVVTVLFERERDGAKKKIEINFSCFQIQVPFKFIIHHKGLIYRSLLTCTKIPHDNIYVGLKD